MGVIATPAGQQGHTPALVLVPSLLLVLAPGLVLAATGRTIDTPLVVMAAVIASLPLLTPLMLRLAGRTWDAPLLSPVWVLCALGLAVIARVQPQLVATQMLWIAAAWSAFVVIVGLPSLLTWLERYRLWLFAASVALVLATLVVGDDIAGRGARLWITLGPLRMQPSEILRIALVIALAGQLASRARATHDAAIELPSRARDWLPLLAILGLAGFAVLLQRDFGPSLVFGGAFVALLYLATGRRDYVAYAVLAGLAVAVIMYAGSDRVQGRVGAWMDPWSDPRGAGYQPLQAVGAFVFGGVFGTGPGYGYPGLIPAAHTDYPLAVIGEEWGLLGSVAVVLLYGLVVTRGLGRAYLGRDTFARLLAAGLVVSLAVQVLLVFGGVLRLIPLTGLTSPFLSYGGSSMITSWVMLALIVSAREAPDPSRLPALMHFAARSRVLGFASLAAFAVLALALGYWHVARGDLLAEPAVAGERWRGEEARIHRGRILDREGRVLAETEIGPDGLPRRAYTDPSSVHALGFTSAQVGGAGVEAVAAERLMGRTARTPLDSLRDLLRQPREGEDVRVTLDLTLQEVASAAMNGASGAVIAIDPRSGDILAMVSNPGFNPNFTAEEWEELRGASESPLLNRATQGLYTPGSTFKTVTLAAALEHGLVRLDSPATCPDEVFIEGVRIINRNEPPGRRTQTVADAFAYSCNTYFAELAVEVGPARLRSTAEALGLTGSVPFALPTAQASLSKTTRFLQSDAGLAATGFGQGELQITPLHLALVVAAIANGGLMPAPRLMLDGAPAMYERVLSPRVARDLAEAMRYSVEAGWASTASIAGAAVGGKSGSAEIAEDESPNALFIAFAPGVEPSIAVAVVLERGGAGSQQAGPVARAVIEAWLASEDTP